MRRISILVCGIVLFTFTSLAQESQVGKNWFISLGAGPNLLEGEQDREFPAPMQRAKITGELSIGKWFTPSIGARIQLSGGALRGFNTDWQTRGGRGNYTKLDIDFSALQVAGRSAHSDAQGNGKNGEGFFQDFNYASFGVDVLGNLNNLIRGYAKKTNAVDVLPHAGIGLIYAMASPTNKAYLDVAFNAGFRFNFNLSQTVAIYLDPQIALIGESFDGHYGEGSRMLDLVPSALLGLQFTFNRSFSSNYGISREEIDYINDRINENRSMIEENRAMIGNQQNIAERQQSLLNQLDGRVTTLENRPATVCAAGTGNQYLPEYVRFSLNSYVIQETERQKIEAAITYLKANSQAKLLLIGYADRKTGNPSANMALSKNRAQAIAAELRKQGIAEDRLILQWKGDNEQPFSQNEWNRVVIMLAR